MRLMILPPADDEKFSAALRAPADALILDPRGDDVAAKSAMVRAKGRILGVALAPLAAPEAEETLAAALALEPDFLLAPEICGKADLQHLGARLAVQEAIAGRPDGSLKILAQIAADPEAIFALDQLGGPNRRLIGLVHDEPALARVLGLAVENHAAAPLVFARGKILLAAARAGVGCFALLGPNGGDALAQIYAGENFKGALVGDPDQLAPAQKIFAVRNG